METKQMEVNNFELRYDGVYTITFLNGKMVQACITLDTLVKMISTEGLELKDIEKAIQEAEPLRFTKVKLVCDIFDKGDGKYSYLSSEIAEDRNMKGMKMVDFYLRE